MTKSFVLAKGVEKIKSLIAEVETKHEILNIRLLLLYSIQSRNYL